MNWGRLIPQVSYSINAYLELVQQGTINIGDPIDFCVPTGNFGNILGVYYAKHYLGLPIRKIICAANANNVLYEFISTGVYDIRDRTLLKTDSPAIDILISSNLERFLFSIFQRDIPSTANLKTKDIFDKLKNDKYFKIDPKIHSVVKQELLTDWCNIEDGRQTMKSVFNQTGIILDPHTSVAVNIAEKYKEDIPMVVASTAHWSKFPEAVDKALNLGLGDSILPSDVYKKISEMRSDKKEENKIHGTIKELEKEEIIHNNECEADYDVVKEKIFSFFKENK